MEHQDWDKVVFKKKAPTTVKDANRRGIGVNTSLRQGPLNTGNIRGSQDGQQLAKLARTEVGSHNKVSKETSTAITNGRLAKRLGQKELAKLINEKPEVIASYESKRAMPNQQVINKLERVLGIHLVGKNIGTVKESKFKTKT